MLRSRYQTIAALALGGCIAACGGGNPETEENLSDAETAPEDVAQYDSIIAGALQQLKESDAASFPCTLFTSEDVADMVGMPVDSGAYTFVHRNENDVEWQSEACAWSTPEDMNTVVDVWVSLPRHFPAGRVACHAVAGADVVPGLENGAWWQYYDGFGLGTLRVCAAAALLEVKVDLGKSATEAQVQETARQVANAIVARLPAAGG